MCGICCGESRLLVWIQFLFISLLFVCFYLLYSYPLYTSIILIVLILWLYYDPVEESRFTIPLQESIPIIDQVLSQWHTLIGPIYTAYHHHCYRVYHLMMGQLQAAGMDISNITPELKQIIAIATVYHDIGIWTEKKHANDINEVDYISPSIKRAVEYIQQQQYPTTWIPLVSEMIEQHHRIRTYHKHIPVPTKDQLPTGLNLVELFRRSDWIDAWISVIRSSISRLFHMKLLTKWPYAGLHQQVIVAGTIHWYTQPKHIFSPLPMMRL